MVAFYHIYSILGNGNIPTDDADLWEVFSSLTACLHHLVPMGYLPMVSLPLKDIRVTSPFGMRRDPMNRAKYRYHSGVDLRARYENVYSMLPGTVSAAGFSKTGGNFVTVNHGVCSCSYLHLSKIRVKVGEHVSAGQNIAVSGNTGSRTTGPHLHLSVRLNTSERKYFNPMLILGFVSEQLLKYEHLK